MYQPLAKTQAPSALKKVQSKRGFNLEDKRQTTPIQRHLQNNSLTNTLTPMQLKTAVKHKTAKFKYGSDNQHSETVGVEMEAWLDPFDPVQGSEPQGQENLMVSLRGATGIRGSGLVRGHLLNHDLGGYGVPENLYPITGGANGAHKRYAENPVGKLLRTAYTANNNTGVYYTVKVVPQLTETSFSNNPSRFICSAKKLSGVTPTSTGSISGGEEINKTIVSDPIKSSGSSYSQHSTDSSKHSASYDATKHVTPGWAHSSRRGRLDFDMCVNAGKINVVEGWSTTQKVLIGLGISALTILALAGYFYYNPNKLPEFLSNLSNNPMEAVDGIVREL